MAQNSGPSQGFDADGLRDVRRWRRSRSDRVISGVCGGIGRALDIDPVLIRVVIAVLTFAGGVGLPLYIAAWLLMPEEGTDTSPAQSVLGDRAKTDHRWLWPVAIVVGIFVMIGIASGARFWPFSFPGWLIAGLLLWFFLSKRRKACAKHGASESHTGEWRSSGGHGAGWHGWSTTAPASTAPSSTPASTGQPVWTEDDPLGLYVDEEPQPPRPATRKPPRPPGMRGVKPAIVAATGLAILIAWLAGSNAPAIAAIGLATLGAGMLLGGFAGRTLALLPLGILLAATVAVTSVFGGWPQKTGEIRFTATPGQQITATHPPYTMDAGSIRLDLSQATFAPGAKIVANSKVGEIIVILPAKVDVTGTMDTQAGEVKAFDIARGGHDVSQSLSDLGTDGKAGPQSVQLDLDMKLGSIRVERK